ESIRIALARCGQVPEAVVQFQPAQGSGGGEFTFSAKKGVDVTEAGVKHALRKTELRNETGKISDRAVTVSTKTLPISPTEKVARTLAKYAGVTGNDVSISS